ncbi:hypothetical protein Taro_002869 [Colocasia esculenta]|uniref:Uncharacterized protein n=1 Tax=Colocasia esculenta TaxID=4460 RepID=A0A843TQ22_COLES|nr:hypothetical protein [Colocasia esculenta]
MMASANYSLPRFTSLETVKGTGPGAKRASRLPCARTAEAEEDEEEGGSREKSWWGKKGKSGKVPSRSVPYTRRVFAGDALSPKRKLRAFSVACQMNWRFNLLR